MTRLRLLFRDPDRAPYLYALRACAIARGLELELVKADFFDPFPEQLLDGAVDCLAENYWGLQQLRASGAPLVSVATAVCILNEKLFVHPDVARLDDLRGGKFAVRGQGPSALIPQLWLSDHGLDDVEAVIVPEGEVGRWGVWKKVLSGECQGCFVTNLYQQEPTEAGLRQFPIEPYGFLGNVTLTTTEGVLTRYRDEFQALVSAAFAASRLFKTDEQAMLNIMRGEPAALLGITDETALQRLYLTLRDELSDVPVPTAEAISNTHRMCIGRFPELRQFNPLLMWDLSMARAAGAAAADGR